MTIHAIAKTPIIYSRNIALIAVPVPTPPLETKEMPKILPSSVTPPAKDIYAGRQIRKLIDKHGFRVNFIAEKTGLNAGVISSMLTGRLPLTHARAYKLAAFFKMTVEHFFAWVEIPVQKEEVHLITEKRGGEEILKALYKERGLKEADIQTLLYVVSRLAILAKKEREAECDV